MAEVFGVVASGIGIAGVAAQAIDGIRKLQTFCNDIRDAPEEVRYLTTELEILLGTIASIEAQIQQNSTMCQNMNPTPALRFVDQSVRSLNAVIEKLNTEITQKRTMGSMKMAWKKKVLESHLMKIERSKTSLGIAVSAYSTELYLQTATRTDTKVDQLSMNVTTLTASSQAQLKLSSDPQINDSQQTRCNGKLLVDDCNNGDWQRIRKKSNPSKQISVKSFKLTLPSWLAHRSLQVDVCRVAQGWTLNLKPYRTISPRADIWSAIARGDFDWMRKLIESGQATVFDRRGDGHTLLHEVHYWASSLGREDFSRIARYLIDRGADINEPSSDGRLAIHMFCCCVTITNQLGRSTDLRDEDVCRIIGDEVDLNEDLFWQPFEGVFAQACSAAFEMELRRRFQSDTLEFPVITLADRLPVICDMPNCYSPQVLLRYLGIESFEIAYPMLNDDSKCELLLGALQHWGSCAGKRNAGSEEWENTIEKLSASGARFELLGHVEEKEESPKRVKGGIVRDEAVVKVRRHFAWHYAYAKLWDKVIGAYYEGEEFSLFDFDLQWLVDGFQYFVSKTEHLGIGLEAKSSCKRFKICMDNKFEEWTDLPCLDDCELEAHTFSLYYDDDLSIWVMWDSMYEEYCGQFWDLIDHPERTMPGTWIE